MMLVNTWFSDTALARTSARQRRPDASGRSRESTLLAARRFYCDLLGGRQVWRTGAAEARRALWFIVAQQVIAVSTDRRSERRTTELEVNDPAALAERCWDAGYGVFVEDPDAGDQLMVVDPFGNRIQLVATEWSTSDQGFAKSS